MKNSTLSKLTLASLLVGISSASDAQAANQLNVTELGSASSIRAQLAGATSQTPIQLAEKEGGEGKCGEGKCGEATCGEGDKDGGEGKCGEGKCGEGKCGESES